MTSSALTSPAPAAVAAPPADSAIATTGEKKKLKPCCACPETKKARDECVVKNGEVHCENLIEAHKACLRSHGFAA